MHRIALPLLAALLATPAAAHAPMMNDEASTPADPYVIDDPEHSKAIYAELDGDPDYYLLTSEEAFDLYVGLTAARVEGCPLAQTFSFEITTPAGEVLDARDGAEFEWWPWFEEFGKRWYWVGPETGADFQSTEVYPAGDYVVRVFNETNTGKYVLAVGDDERFGPGVLLSLPRVSRESRAWWDAAGC